MQNSKTKDPTRKSTSILFAICFIAYAFSYIGRMNFSTCMNPMISDGLFDTEFGGFITTAYLVCYGSGQLINGILSSKLHPKYIIGTGLFGVGLCNLLMGLCSEKWIFLVVWGLNGFFNSMLWSPLIRLFSEWMVGKTRDRAGKNISVSLPVGTIISYVISSVVLSKYSWRVVFYCCSACLFVSFIIWVSGIFSIRKYLSKPLESCNTIISETVNPNTKEEISETPKKVSLISAIIVTGLIVIYVEAIMFGVINNISNWIPKILVDTYSISDSTSAMLSIIIPIFNIFGAYVACFINDKFAHNELTTTGIMFLICAVSYFLAFLMLGHNLILTVVFSAIGSSSAWGINTMILTFIPYRFSKVHLSSSITGSLNCLIYFTSALTNSACGIIRTKTGTWSPVLLGFACASTIGVIVGAIFFRMWKNRRSTFE